MFDNDKEMQDMLSRAEVPPHSDDLANRIIANVLASNPAGAGDTPPQRMPQVKQKEGFSHWWHEVRALHGRKLALAASVAAVAVIIFDPAGRITENYLENKQVTEAERYTVHGLSLLADVNIIDEPDLKMEEVVEFADS
jgi:hypothetical protein